MPIVGKNECSSHFLVINLDKVEIRQYSKLNWYFFDSAFTVNDKKI